MFGLPFSWWSRWFKTLPFFDPPTKRIPKTSEEIAREIDAILYSEQTPEEMLEALKPLVAIGEHARLFIKRTGLTPLLSFQIGPYPTDYWIPPSGLELVMDDLFIVHIIRRASRQVGSIHFPCLYLTAPFMQVDGYGRFYHQTAPKTSAPSAERRISQ